MAFRIAYVDIESLISMTKSQTLMLQETATTESPEIRLSALSATETAPASMSAVSTTKILPPPAAAGVFENSLPLLPIENKQLNGSVPAAVQDAARDETGESVTTTAPARSALPSATEVAPAAKFAAAALTAMPTGEPEEAQTSTCAATEGADLETIFRHLLEKFKFSVVYDYSPSDMVETSDQAERKNKAAESPARRGAGEEEELRAEEWRQKLILAKEELKREALKDLLAKMENADKLV